MIKDLEPGLQLGSSSSQSYNLDKALQLLFLSSFTREDNKCSYLIGCLRVVKLIYVKSIE